MSEDAAGSPFGLKLAAVNSTLNGATVTGPAGSPASISVDLGATNPNDGDSISYTFTLPDGTSQTLQLQATTSATPGPNQFTIGATPAATAVNLQAALTAGVSQIGSTSLSAASAMAASNDFFDDPPQRVSGSPRRTATALVDGTSANTVIWYTGEDGSGSARSTATARIDPSTTVSYGTRANEQGIRWIVQNIAALAATSYSSSDPNASASYTALNQPRLYRARRSGRRSKHQRYRGAAWPTRRTPWLRRKSQHQQTDEYADDHAAIDRGGRYDQLGAQILSLQTSLSASLSTTARLARSICLNYLSPVTG